MSTKVKLYTKAISGNRLTYYLDFYPAIINPKTGKLSRREFLGLYILSKPKNPIEKQSNKETTQIAEQIRQKKESQLNKPEIYTGYEKEQLKIKEQGEQNFVEYFKILADKRKASNHDNWISAYAYLNTFTGGILRFDNLNEKFCNDFRDYLLTTKSRKSSKSNLSQNSAVSYFNKLKATLKQAYKDGLMSNDLNARIDVIKQAETHRNFLTVQELNKLIKTDCKSQIIKNAALFSALTGLRFSDIQKLLWKEVEYIKGKGNGYFIQFKQQKTKGAERMPISKQAFNLLGDRKKPDTKVFDGLTYSAYSNKHLANWLGLAGITKDITFHCFRHTYATLQLANGTDIYTLSKMLGHRELKTTQIYAKVIDKTKREASNKIVLNF